MFILLILFIQHAIKTLKIVLVLRANKPYFWRLVIKRHFLSFLILLTKKFSQYTVCLPLSLIMHILILFNHCIVPNIEFILLAQFQTYRYNHAKELSFCHKFKYSYPYILATQCHRPQIFQTISSVRSNNLSLKFQRFTPTGCRDIEMRKFEFAAKTQFLSKHRYNHAHLQALI